MLYWKKLEHDRNAMSSELETIFRSVQQDLEQSFTVAKSKTEGKQALPGELIRSLRRCLTTVHAANVSPQIESRLV